MTLIRGSEPCVTDKRVNASVTDKRASASATDTRVSASVTDRRVSASTHSHSHTPKQSGVVISRLLNATEAHRVHNYALDNKRTCCHTEREIAHSHPVTAYTWPVSPSADLRSHGA